MYRCEALAAVLALSIIAPWTPGVAVAADRLPVFDTHLHYNRDAWDLYGPRTVIGMLDAANVPRALVSSTPDDGTLKLYRADAGRFVPVLRPYRAGVGQGNWFRDPELAAYIEQRLKRGIYAGIGEFHLFDADEAGTPLLRRIVELAVERDIMFHVHCGAGPVRALFALEPRLKILWAHAGRSEPPEVIGELIARYSRLWTEVSLRGYDIAPEGRLDAAWRDLFLRHSDRFMIGTDTYVTSRWEVYPDLVEEHRRWLAQFPREVAEAIAYRNAVRHFGAGNRKALRD